MFCQNCGASLADGVKFCPACGARQEPAASSARTQNLCPFCGTALEPDSVFCDNCGRKLGSSAPAYRPREAAYSTPAAAPAQSGRTDYTPSRPQTAGRRITVSAKPEMRILGIPVRGKAMWIVLAVIAAAVIGLVIYTKLGGTEEKGGETARTSFAAREEQRDAEAAPEDGDRTTGAFSSAAKALQEARSGQEETRAAEPEASEKAEPEPEPEPEPEQGSKAQPGPKPKSEPEPGPDAPQGSAPLPFADSLGIPAASDFAWIADAQSGDLTGSFLGNDELVGKWKGEILYDGVWELVYVTIDTNGQIAIEPYQINYGDGWEDETGEEPYRFDGTFDISSVSGTGNYGSISLYTFLESHGAQYGVGSFSVNSGDRADVYLVRP